ncbi:putative Ubiquitin-activating enzyme E1 [Pseudoloma neurophilia]|uniref:Putative Ubiquitin-activating enzyme E1 n=1 Tax=Pseudoloma neurophilia TaxID=146866 RepID=A0A0R0M124_9MICR|nr:putative Ubiquitin-activating enzyme E1 [Pseudoloma neurophilia]
MSELLNDFLKEKRILIAGAGTTGSEILKYFIFYEQLDLTILDFDTVMLSDLNRQFFFRESDIGRRKVAVISEYFLKFYNKKIKVIDKNLFDCEIEEFDLIFCCFDNIESRMELNIRISGTKCILIDIGIENLNAHVKKVIFEKTSCLFCIKDLYKQDKFRNICSLKGSQKREDQIYALLQKFESISNQEIARKRNTQDVIPENLKVFNEIQKSEIIIRETIDAFNTSNKKKTDEFEVIGIKDNIIANTCFIASIATAFAIAIIFDNENDFWFYNGANTPYITKTKIQKDHKCFICNK